MGTNARSPSKLYQITCCLVSLQTVFARPVPEPQVSDRLGSDINGVLFDELHRILSSGSIPSWASALVLFNSSCASDTVESWFSCTGDVPYGEFRFRTRENLSSGLGGPPGMVLRTTCDPGSEALGYNRLLQMVVRGEQPVYYSACEINGISLNNINIAVGAESKILYAAYGVAHHDGYHQIAPFHQVRRWTFDDACNVKETRPWRSMAYAAKICCQSSEFYTDAS